MYLEDEIINPNFIIRDKTQGNHHYRFVDLKEYDTDKSIVIVLGGNGVITTREANGCCKLIESQLRLLFDGGVNGTVEDNIDLIGVVYTSDDENAYACTGEMSEYDICTLIDYVMVPKCIDEVGAKLPVGKVCQNLSKITFCSFCQGAKEVSRICSELEKKLLFCGYSEDEIDKILNSMMQISYAPLVSDNPIPSIRFLSVRDNNGQIGVANKSKVLFGDDFSGIDFNYDEPGYMYGEDCQVSRAESIQVFSSNLLNAIFTPRDEHYLALLGRDKNWDVNGVRSENGWSKSDNADCMSQMMSWVLCRAVENGIKNSKSDTYIPLPSASEFRDDLESILHAFDSKYLGINRDYLEFSNHSEIDANEKAERMKMAWRQALNAGSYEQVFSILDKFKAFELATGLVPLLYFLDEDEKAVLLAQAQLAREESNGMGK